MSYTTFDVTIENQIAHIVLNRPDKRNSMNLAFWNELPAAVKDIDHGSKARVIVISSTGPHFSAGLDVAEFFNPKDLSEEEQRIADLQRAEAFYDNVKVMQDSFTALEQCRLPVLAAIQGGCIGGGVDLTTACDMRYACDGAFFTIFEINVGMTADVGTFPRICSLLPEGVVRELAYTGRKMPAEEALQRGLLNAVYPDQETMLKEVMAIASEIASKPPLAIRGCKHIINYTRDHSTADTLDYIAAWNMSMLIPEQMMEAMQSRMEKRRGNYVDHPPASDKVGLL